MAYAHKVGQGTLWKIEDKKNPAGPDVKGDILHECPSCGHQHKIELAGWKKQGKNSGSSYLSLKASKPWVPEGKREPAPSPAPGPTEDPGEKPDDSLPF